jgi:hypothetical protein
MQKHSKVRRIAQFSFGILFATALIIAPIVSAQSDPQFQERITQIKRALALNKELIGGYTWEEQQTISIKGQVKKQALYQVQMGADGQLQKTELDPATPPSEGRSHGIKHRIVAEKTEEFDTYAKQLGELAQLYLGGQPGRLQELYQTGGVTFGPASTPQEVRIILNSYAKPGDSATIVFNTTQNAVQSIKISSYLNDHKDAVNIDAQYRQEPNGMSHVAVLVLDGVSKHLTIETQSSNYRLI